MKTLIVSDNHRDADRLEDIIHIYRDEIDLWLHCGDSEFGEDHAVWKLFKTVKGNMDWEDNFPSTRVEEVDGTTFAMVHGHRHDVRYSLDAMAEVARDNTASIVFYGHTHRAQVDKQGGVFFINPGSISQPRGPLRVGSYAIYEEKAEGKFIRFYDWNHNEIEELSQKLS